jgi:hypothetical protein
MTSSAEVPESELAAIERRAAQASTAPWQAFVEGRDHTSGDTFIRMGGTDMAVPDMYISFSGPGPGVIRVPDADIDFIANARQDIPRLVAEIRHLRILLTEP